MAALTEDDIYRTSSQYRLWSFTKDSLALLRNTTNASAADGVRAAIESLHAEHAAAGGGTKDESSSQVSAKGPQEVDCLTVEEEQKLVGFYCVKAIEFSDFCEFPTNVKATAVQYIKRFYLSNSPMTYHPKELMLSALFLSTKTENHYTSLRSFVSKLPKTTAEDVIAPEFLLTQGLRFTFDVRHPQRALDGTFMELMALAKGDEVLTNGNGNKIQSIMIGLEPMRAGEKRTKTAEEVGNRIKIVQGKVKAILKTSALLTDVYFLFTPSQICLSALLLVDFPLTNFYLETKFPTPSALKSKLINVLQSCATMLESSPSADPGETEKKQLTKIDKKLYKCRNPEKIDLVGINKAQKRDGEGKEGEGLDEKIIKKRKLEREKSEKEGDDLFGPAIGKSNGN